MIVWDAGYEILLSLSLSFLFSLISLVCIRRYEVFPLVSSAAWMYGKLRQFRMRLRKWFVTGLTMECCVPETTKIRNKNKWNTFNWRFFVFSRTAQCEFKLLPEKPGGRRPIVNHLRFAKRWQTLMLRSFNSSVIHSLWFLHRCVCWQNDLSELYRNYHSAIFFIFTQSPNLSRNEQASGSENKLFFVREINSIN